MANKTGNSKNKMKEKLEKVEKSLIEHHAAHQKPRVPIDHQWMARVMEQIQNEPIPTSPGYFALSNLQEKLIWRFSGVAAAVSLALLILYLTLGHQLNLEMMANLLLDPLSDVGLRLIGA